MGLGGYIALAVLALALLILIIRNDYIKERIINAVADTIKKIIPEHMLDEHLKKFSIKL